MSTVVLFFGGGSLLTDNPKTKQVTELSVTCFSIQRRGRDSNPRNSCPFTAFRVRPDRPLRHLSLVLVVISECKYMNIFFIQTNLMRFFISSPHFYPISALPARHLASDCAERSQPIPLFAPYSRPPRHRLSTSLPIRDRTRAYCSDIPTLRSRE